MSVCIRDGFQSSLGFVPRNYVHLWASTVEDQSADTMAVAAADVPGAIDNAVNSI
ncbi:hypothetical protein MJD09_08425 [bacterium]|nr:hypothetical protein [bacterium]